MNGNASPYWFHASSSRRSRTRSKALGPSPGTSGAGLVGSRSGSEVLSSDEEGEDPVSIFRDFRRAMADVPHPDLTPEERYTILCSRAQEQLRFSRLLLAMSPISEYAVLTPGPSEIAAGAAHDAEAALKLQPGCVAALQYKADAMEVEEQVTAAAAASRSREREGMRPPATLPAPEASAGVAVARSPPAWRAEAADDMECPLCLKILMRPVTTPCGHTFCQPCLPRCLDHTSRCPTCRMDLSSSSMPAVSYVLQSLIQRLFPEELAAREQEEEEEEESLAELVPMFVMSLLLPGEHMSLNIFEPRYRDMVRRCMQGNRRFAMVARRPGGTSDDLLPAACEVEITHCVVKPDGMYGVHVVGRRRFFIDGTQEMGGLLYAHPQWISDLAPIDQAGEDLLARCAEETKRRADSWISRLRKATQSQSRMRLRPLLDSVGDRPLPGEHEALSFWAAALVVHLGDDPEGNRRKLLDLRNTGERLVIASRMLAVTQQRLTGSCSIC